MTDIFSGKGFSLFYNTDTGNRSPQGVGNIKVNEIAAFPILQINSGVTELETYDSDYSTKLLAEQDVSPLEIVVNYIPDDSTHSFLDTYTDNRTVFQLVLQYREGEGTIDYAIVNGAIRGFSLTGDKDSVITKTYQFQPTELVTRAVTSVSLPPLFQSDFGLGSNGRVPQYETDAPTGNGFIKVTSSMPGNPASTDLMGMGLVDGTSTSALVVTKSGTLSLFAKNASTAWTRIYTATQIGSLYTPLTRTVNKKPLSTDIVLTPGDVGAVPVERTVNGYALDKNIVLNSSDIGSVPVTRTINGHTLDKDMVLTSTDTGSVPETRTVNGHALDEDIVLTSTDTGSVPDTRTVNGHALDADLTLTKADVGLSQVLNEKQLVQASNLADVPDVEKARTNLNVYSKGESVPKTLTVNGHTLSTDIVLSKDDVGLSNVTDDAQLKAASNLADVPDVAEARNNLAVLSSEEIASTYLTKASNLEDVEDVDLARQNLSGAKSGINTDITSLTALSGPLRLGGDASSDYDAVTLRQLRANSGGSVGPTLSGVMNNFIGCVEWFNGSRAKLPAGYVAADGQIAKRSDLPDLWAAVAGGIFKAIEDGNKSTSGTWLYVDGITTASMRGCYSKGGDGTTSGQEVPISDTNNTYYGGSSFTGEGWFRLPDLNGARNDTLLRAMFLRGDGAGLADSELGGVGTIKANGTPNITGTLTNPLVFQSNNFTGAFNKKTESINLTTGSTGTPNIGGANVDFDASKSNAAYGRASEVRPNSIEGIWIIRVSGSFTAANTNFHVINEDKTLPATGTIVYGGDIFSDYKVAGANYSQVRLRSKTIIGSSMTPELSLINNSGSTTSTITWTFPASGGELVSTSDSRLSTVSGKTGGTISGTVAVSNAPRTAAFFSASSNTWEESTGVFRNVLGQSQVNANSFGMVDAIANNNTGRAYVRLIPFANASTFYVYSFDHTGEATARVFTPLSDEQLKYDIERVQNPLDKMKEIRGVTFRYKESDIFGIGFTSQDVEKVFPESVSESPVPVKFSDGTVLENVKRPDTYGVAAALHHEAILALMDKIEGLENQIQTLINNK